MQNKDFLKFLTAQKNAIEKAIYLESEKAHKNLHYDPKTNQNDEVSIQWVNQHASNFDKAWDKSICKNCKKIYNCNDCLKEICDNFEQEV